MPRCKKPTCSELCKSGKACKRQVKQSGDKCPTHRQDVCPCCHEVPSGTAVEKTECGHTFHWACLSTWADTQTATIKTCPVCRAALADKFQWPKMINTRLMTWPIYSQKYALDMLDFIATEGWLVARELDAIQVLVESALHRPNYEELMSKMWIPGLTICMVKKQLAYKFPMSNSHVVMHIPFKNMGFDSWGEFKELRAGLSALLHI